MSDQHFKKYTSFVLKVYLPEVYIPEVYFKGT